MSAKSGLTMKQVNNWFINARERVIKKYVIRQPNKIVKSKKNRREDHSDELDDWPGLYLFKKKEIFMFFLMVVCVDLRAREICSEIGFNRKVEEVGWYWYE